MFRVGISTDEDLYPIIGNMEEGGTNTLDFLA